MITINLKSNLQRTINPDYIEDIENRGHDGSRVVMAGGDNPATYDTTDTHDEILDAIYHAERDELLNKFAAAALTGILSARPQIKPDEAARIAFLHGQAMIEASEA